MSCPAGVGYSAVTQNRSLLLGIFQHAFVARTFLLSNHGSHFHLVETVAYANRARVLGQLFDELIVHRLMHEKSFGGNADLAAVHVGGKRGTARDHIDRRRRHHDKWIVARGFDQRRLHHVATFSSDCTPGRYTAGKRYHVGSCMLNQLATCITCTGQHLE